MKKHLSFLFLLLLASFAFAQNKKLQSATDKNFYVAQYLQAVPGTFTYKYYIDSAGNRLKHGPFNISCYYKFQLSNIIAAKYITVSYKASGSFADGVFNGPLKVTRTVYDNWNKRTGTYTLSANYRNGMPHGEQRMNVVEEDGDNTHVVVNYRDGALVGKVDLRSNNGASYNSKYRRGKMQGQLDDSSRLHGHWFIEEDGIEGEYDFYHGVLLWKVERNMSGEVIKGGPHNAAFEQHLKDYADGKITLNGLKQFGIVFRGSKDAAIWVVDDFFVHSNQFDLDCIGGERFRSKLHPKFQPCQWDRDYLTFTAVDTASFAIIDSSMTVFANEVSAQMFDEKNVSSLVEMYAREGRTGLYDYLLWSIYANVYENRNVVFYGERYRNGAETIDDVQYYLNYYDGKYLVTDSGTRRIEHFVDSMAGPCCSRILALYGKYCDIKEQQFNAKMDYALNGKKFYTKEDDTVYGVPVKQLLSYSAGKASLSHDSTVVTIDLYFNKKNDNNIGYSTYYGVFQKYLVPKEGMPTDFFADTIIRIPNGWDTVINLYDTFNRLNDSVQSSFKVERVKEVYDNYFKVYPVKITDSISDNIRMLGYSINAVSGFRTIDTKLDSIEKNQARLLAMRGDEPDIIKNYNKYFNDVDLSIKGAFSKCINNFSDILAMQNLYLSFIDVKKQMLSNHDKIEADAKKMKRFVKAYDKYYESFVQTDKATPESLSSYRSMVDLQLQAIAILSSANPDDVNKTIKENKKSDFPELVQLLVK